ncbi:hypothetical protein C2E20_6670 [Micractinium conductrix]|uniref:Uncharacterized protein n=1 Tax=Micractinium conductrix TaxID=554055 RepID=A0A2P6V708_9CHLO|nr:hypothetical protein C2E20_6670 [Micractinium conductrix]|eukprot:PSC69858.1 hypothetical protein C2E20_6670 [Micractinium conductrix]
MRSRTAAFLLLAALAVGSCNAVSLEECSSAYSQQAMNIATCFTIQSGACPDSCKQALQALVDCYELIKDYIPADLLVDQNGQSITIQQWFEQLCSGNTPVPVPSPSPVPEPSPSPVPEPSPSPTPNLPPGIPVLTGLASNFTCDTAAGFAWVPLNASLASIVEGADPDAGPAVALNSTCADLNVTGCCTEAPSGNFSWVQYGLGQPMVVQGLRVTAPSGGCCAEGDCLAWGTEPCNERLTNAFIYVSNASIADLKASEEWKQYVALLDTTGALAGYDEDMFLYSLVAGNYSAGLCNVVTPYDLYADGTTDGTMINNGTIDVGCGLGLWGTGTVNVTSALPGFNGGTFGGIGAGAGVKTPLGSYLTFERLDTLGVPLAFCGLEVCAKAATTTPPPS